MKFLECINLIARLISFTERPKDIASWFDEELEEKMRVRDYFYHKLYNLNASLESSDILSKFKQHKAEFQALKREKQKEYFKSKNIYDFKNNKLFWDFYSPFINIKSSKSNEFTPNTFFHDEREYDDPEEIGKVFNTFFTSLSSTSLSSDKDCDDYIDKTFAKLKREKKSN